VIGMERRAVAVEARRRVVLRCVRGAILEMAPLVERWKMSSEQ
jgi:hypothetical protein